MTNPAKQLVGLELEGSWRVAQPVDLGDDHSGGYFSQGYLVEQRGSGRRGFLRSCQEVCKGDQAATFCSLGFTARTPST
jgi:hypothetical protein